MRQKVILIILDGWGHAPSWGGNAVEAAETPNMNVYWRKYPHVTLKAAEEAVGLPIHEPGNSEVGHLNLGTGQIVRQNLPGISLDIKEGRFANNPIILEAIDNAKKNASNIHLMGLVSDGGVHSHISHLFALLDLLKEKNAQNVYIHMFTDGRDTDPMKSLTFIAMLEKKIKEIGLGKVESVMGRYYAMDRDNRWDRVQKAYDVLTSGIGPTAESAQKAISASYRQGQYDEFIVPTTINNEHFKFVPIQTNDTVIFFNFRSDRTKELTTAFVAKNFNGFARKKFVSNLYFATFAFNEDYVRPDANVAVKVVFKPTVIQNTIAKILSENHLKQLHIAETEKYAHVTYFFNGGVEKPYAGEVRQLIASPRVATYDLKPEMSAKEITKEVISKLNNFDFIVVNFANLDMVGHTGNLKATITACETVDEDLGQIVNAALKAHYVIIVTGDHGNAEQMINPNNGEPHTEHTINPVPFILISEDPKFQNPLRQDGSHGTILSDVAPTILKIMGIQKPQDMTGESLIE